MHSFSPIDAFSSLIAGLISSSFVPFRQPSPLTKRFQIEDTTDLLRIWTGMLLTIRTGVLMGLERPDQEDIKAYAKTATDFL